MPSADRRRRFGDGEHKELLSLVRDRAPLKQETQTKRDKMLRKAQRQLDANPALHPHPGADDPELEATLRLSQKRTVGVAVGRC